MPPWAAFECERTGWTLEMIPTDAPSSAAARAARWPARPAPMTRTSCWGIFGEAGAILWKRYGRHSAPGDWLRNRSPRRRRLRAARGDRVHRHDPAQHAVAVHRHHRHRGGRGPPGPAATRAAPRGATRRPLSPSSRAITDATGRLVADPPAPRSPPPPRDDHPHEPAGPVDHREPGPAVAQEVLALGLVERGGLGDRDRLGVHHVRHAQVARCARRRRPAPAPTWRPARGTRR